MSWKDEYGLSKRIQHLPLILCGPILRRTEEDSVTVWVAVKESRTVTLRIYKSEPPSIEAMTVVLRGTRKTIQLGEHLHVVAVTARPVDSGPKLVSGELYFYNLFFSFIAVIFGQSICLNFWINRPKTFLTKLNYRKTSILNDQGILNNSFINWFAKFATLFLLFFSVMTKGYYVFSFYPDYNYFFILIIIVLYLQSWNTTRLTFKNRSIKWFLISALILSGLAFLISQINIIDYKKFGTN